MQVAASWRDILVLVDNIKSNLKKIQLYNGTLAVQLKTLESTFRDEGIDIIRNHIAKTKSQIEETVPEFKIVLEKLIAYAYLLKQSEENIRER
jgi:hypothetical protein